MSQVRVVLKSVWDDKGLKNAQDGFKKLGSSISKIGAALAVGFSFKALIGSARAAAEDAKSQALLAEQLRNTTGANDLMIASVEESIRQMQISAAVADDVLRPAFGQLVRATGDVSEATRLMQIALDVSAATGRDVNAVAIALSRAYQGNTTSLSRLGIKAEEGVDVFAMLEEQFAGAAETAARNDPFQRLTIIFGELEEQIGQNFLPLLNDVADYFASAEFSDAFRDLAINVGLAVEQIDILFKQVTGDTALTSFINLVGSISYEISKLAILFQALSKSAGLWFSGNWIEAARFDPAAYVRDQIKKLDAELARLRRVANSPAVGGPMGTRGNNDGGGGAGGGGGGDNAKKERDKVVKDAKDLLAKTQEAIANARAEYAQQVAEINSKYIQDVADTQADFAAQLSDIVQQSMNRLRDAFKSAVEVNISDLFSRQTVTEIQTEVRRLTNGVTYTVSREVQKTVGGSVQEMIDGLKDRLQKSQSLIKNASDLAAKGFSQTFIEQVVGSGLETGNELAQAILASTPEAQKELSDLFKQVEQTSETGMDGLAKSIYDKQGLATTELKNLYTQTQGELTNALLALQTEFQSATTEANKTFVDAIKKIGEELDSQISLAMLKVKGFKDELLKIKGEIAGITSPNTAPINPTSITPIVPKVPVTTNNKTTTNITLNVNANDRNGGYQAGQQVVKLIKDYQKVAGPVSSLIGKGQIGML